MGGRLRPTSYGLVGRAAEAVDPASSADAPHAFPGLGSALQRSSNGTSVRSEGVEIAEEDGNRLEAIAFEFETAGDSDRGLAPAAQNQFKLDLCRELERLKKWAADLGWSGIQVSELRVVVSDRFKISRSLVPAWSGRAGHMEFPAWRVDARKAAILHELVHVLFPNGNRFLAEGLAVHLQAAIGGNPAFPNFGRPLHEVARECLQELPAAIARDEGSILEEVHLTELDAIATPSPLTLGVGREFYGEGKRGQAFIYPIAGSFVQFLIETRGMEKFRSLYAQTPLVPLSQNAGSTDRWSSVYGVELADLDNEWKSMIVSGGLRRTPGESMAATVPAADRPFTATQP